jgi:hypothetical protein
LEEAGLLQHCLHNALAGMPVSIGVAMEGKGFVAGRIVQKHGALMQNTVGIPLHPSIYGACILPSGCVRHLQYRFALKKQHARNESMVKP